MCSGSGCKDGGSKLFPRQASSLLPALCQLRRNEKKRYRATQRSQLKQHWYCLHGAYSSVKSAGMDEKSPFWFLTERETTIAVGKTHHTPIIPPYAPPKVPFNIPISILYCPLPHFILRVQPRSASAAARAASRAAPHACGTHRCAHDNSRNTHCRGERGCMSACTANR